MIIITVQISQLYSNHLNFSSRPVGYPGINIPNAGQQLQDVANWHSFDHLTSWTLAKGW